MSALYGAAVVGFRPALMRVARRAGCPRLSVATSAFSVLLWSVVKIGTSVLMLVLATKVVEGLNWPALLIALVLCMQIYGLALLWRGRPTELT